MSLQASHFALLDDLSSRLASESIFAKSGSDEGLIPAYSLLTDMLGPAAEAPELMPPLQSLHARFDSLLGEAKPFDDDSVKQLRDVVAWLPDALAAARAQGRAEAAAHGTNGANGANGFAHGVNGANGHAYAGATGSAAPVVVAAAAPAPVGKADASSDEDTDEVVDEILQLDLAENRELLGEFHAEAIDHLQQIEAALLALDARPDDRDALNGLFRSFHTIKGVSGFLRLTPMHKLTHEVESLLDLARTDKLRLTPAIITEILSSRDAIQEMVAQITLALEQNRLPDKVVPVSHLIAAVRRLAAGGASAGAAVSPTPAAAASAAAPAAVAAAPAPVAAKAPEAAVAAPAVVADTHGEPADASKAAAASAASGTRALMAVSSSSSVRVNTEKLDSLVDVVGELVIVQSQLRESAKGLDNSGNQFTRNLAQLNRITKDLQLTAMSLRMVPIKPTFQRMERLVRDLSRDFGKQVVFETQGEETEIDRTVVEEIVDPLVHMVRNSLDHGLEPPDKRRASGKSETGRMRLAAYHEGGNLVIELADDGRGIDRAKVLSKARAQGLVPEGVTPPPEEIVNLIFLPGFSTADKVTSVSGRGVGMDVVKRNIERLRGQIQIETEMGKGTTFRIRLPLTTAIIDGLLVRVGEDRFILPTLAVQMAMRPSKEMLATVQGRGEVIDHRGHILPIRRLHRCFNIQGAVEDATQGIIVIVELGGKTYALLVDELLNKQEVVIKNLGAFLQNLPGVAGGAILGDGTIALILDPASIPAS